MIAERSAKKRERLSESEAEYLAEGVLGRLATVSPAGEPHVVPVAYRFDGECVTIGGWNMEGSLKFRNMVANGRAALVVDDIVSVDPWVVRGVEIRGTAEPVDEGRGGVEVKIRPRTVRSWGLQG